MKPKTLLCPAFLVLTLSAVAFIFSSPAQSPSDAPAMPPRHPRIIDFHLPGGLGRGIFSEQANGLSVQWTIGWSKVGENSPASATNAANLQIWLLKTDGTSIPQVGKPSRISMGGIGDSSTDFMFYTFAKIPTNEIAGIAVRLNAKLYCQEFGAESK